MIVILIGILINNVHLTDVKEALRAEMDKNHSEMLHRVGDLDTRLTRIENGRIAVRIRGVGEVRTGETSP
jgi:hypothetical protein